MQRFFGLKNQLKSFGRTFYLSWLSSNATVLKLTTRSRRVYLGQIIAAMLLMAALSTVVVDRYFHRAQTQYLDMSRAAEDSLLETAKNTTDSVTRTDATNWAGRLRSNQDKLRDVIQGNQQYQDAIKIITPFVLPAIVWLSVIVFARVVRKSSCFVDEDLRHVYTLVALSNLLVTSAIIMPLISIYHQRTLFDQSRPLLSKFFEQIFSSNSLEVIKFMSEFETQSSTYYGQLVNSSQSVEHLAPYCAAVVLICYIWTFFRIKSLSQISFVTAALGCLAAFAVFAGLQLVMQQILTILIP